MGLLGSALATPVGALGQGPLSRIVVFGDSLSDTGDAFALGRENNTPPDYSADSLLIPDDAYARGGHHFTNGSTWVEDLARPLGLAADVSPALRDSNSRATNYAVGGARAHDDGKNIDLSAEVQDFLGDSGGSAGSDALYVIEIGGNDVRDALGAALVGGSPLTIIDSGVTATGTNIGILYGAGARKFLVWNVANIGLTPSVRTLDTQFPGAGIAATAGVLTQVYNAELAGFLAALPQTLPGIEILQFDLYGEANLIHANPASFGLTDVDHACITPDIPPFICKSPDDYFFWDGVHPTKTVHAIIAEDVARLLAE